MEKKEIDKTIKHYQQEVEKLKKYKKEIEGVSNVLKEKKKKRGV